LDERSTDAEDGFDHLFAHPCFFLVLKIDTGRGGCHLRSLQVQVGFQFRSFGIGEIF
jgi:hypothetical protein